MTCGIMCHLSSSQPRISGIMEFMKKARSREYPAISLKKAIDLARRIYEKDRFTVAPAESAARTMGFAGLNGGSRPTLSALKKYGLLDYQGSGDKLSVSLSAEAKRFFLGTEPDEQREVVVAAISRPTIYQEIFSEWPDWALPSNETLGKKLELQYGLQHKAIPSFISDLHEGIEYVKSLGGGPVTGNPEFRGSDPESGTSDDPEPNVGLDPKPGPGLMKIPMPGSEAFIALPQAPSTAEAKRILRWLNQVVTPAVEFAAEDHDE